MTVSDEVVKVLESAMLAEPGSLRGDLVLAEVSALDSMALVAFMGDVADRWRVDLSFDDVMGCRTVDDLVQIVVSRARGRSG